jgi:hypothetical protein
VHVFPEAKPEPGLKGVWRLGEYLDPGPPSAFRGFEGLGRHIALYYGSFLQVAGPGFDWEGEVWETLLHELRHHLESLAGRDDSGKGGPQAPGRVSPGWATFGGGVAASSRGRRSAKPPERGW